MEAHKQAIAKVAASVRYFFKRNEPYRIFHGSTNSTRPCQRNKTVDISTLSNVLEADVKRYFPWQFGVDYDVIGRGSAQDLFDEQLDVRDLLRSQNRMEWVIVSNRNVHQLSL